MPAPSLHGTERTTSNDSLEKATHRLRPADARLPTRPGEVERRRNADGRYGLVLRFRKQFQDLPGMQLTVMQAQRLFGVRPDICGRVLLELVREGFLWRCPDGSFARRQAIA